MKTVLLAITLFALTFGAFAQAPPSTPPTTVPGYTIQVNGAFSSISNAADNNGFQTTESLALSPHISARADQFVVLSPSAVVALAEGEYRRPLSDLIKPSKGMTFNTSNIVVFANAGAGTARSSATVNGQPTLSAARFAWKVGGGFDYLINGTLSVRPLDLSYVRAGILTNGGQIFGNHLQLAAGLGLRF